MPFFMKLFCLLSAEECSIFFVGGSRLGTMLQNLSKCEVKAWLFWNLIILLPLRFYVKCNVGEIKQSKNIILAILEVINFDFSIFGQISCPKFTNNSKFRGSEIAKNVIFRPCEFTQIWFYLKSKWHKTIKL